MRRALVALTAALAAALACAARAQEPAADAIDAALQASAPVATAPPAAQEDEDEDRAESRPAPPEQATPPPPPAERVYARPTVPEAPPGRIDEVGRGPGAPSTPNELNYEARIKASVLAAQGLQGPLDGAWVLRSSDGAPLYAFQLVDRGDGMAALEGVWRDLSRPGAPAASGFVDSIDRYGMALTIRFSPRAGGQGVEARLEPVVGGWAGQLSGEGPPAQVALKRN